MMLFLLGEAFRKVLQDSLSPPNGPIFTSIADPVFQLPTVSESGLENGGGIAND
jgi:hypothetical protein